MATLQATGRRFALYGGIPPLGEIRGSLRWCLDVDASIWIASCQEDRELFGAVTLEIATEQTAQITEERVCRLLRKAPSRRPHQSCLLAGTTASLTFTGTGQP